MSILFVVQFYWDGLWEDDAHFETFDGALQYVKQFPVGDSRVISRTENILAEFKDKP